MRGFRTGPRLCVCAEQRNTGPSPRQRGSACGGRHSKKSQLCWCEETNRHSKRESKKKRKKKAILRRTGTNGRVAHLCVTRTPSMSRKRTFMVPVSLRVYPADPAGKKERREKEEAKRVTLKRGRLRSWCAPRLSHVGREKKRRRREHKRKREGKIKINAKCVRVQLLGRLAPRRMGEVQR